MLIHCSLPVGSPCIQAALDLYSRQRVRSLVQAEYGCQTVKSFRPPNTMS